MNNDIKTEDINIKFENIISTLKDILGSKKNIKSEEATNRELEEIYKVEKETGGTSHIKELINDIETHKISDNKKRRTKKSQMLDSKNSSSKELKTQEKDRETGDVLDR